MATPETSRKQNSGIKQNSVQPSKTPPSPVKKPTSKQAPSKGKKGK